MNEEPPPPLETVGDESVEARIVAWVLGETSAFEAAELQRLCEERPELLVFRRRMRALHGLLTEVEAAEKDHSWKLSEQKREVLDEIFGKQKVTRLEPEKELRIRHSGRRAFLAIAACLVLTLVVARLIGPIGRISPMKSAVTTDTATTPHATSEHALQELNKAVRDQEDKVEERRKVLATIVRTKGIIYKGQDSFYGQSGVDEDQGARSALQTYNQLAQEKLQKESQINSLLKYDGDQLMTYASGLDLPDNTIRNLQPQYLDAKRQLESARTNGLGNDHPTVKAAAEQVQATKRQMDEGVVNLRSTLQAQLDMTTDRLKKVEAMKDDSREVAIKRGLDAQDYADAKREFESDQQLLQALKLKQIEQTIAAKISGGSLAMSAPASPVAESARREDGTYQIEASKKDAGLKQSAKQNQLAKQSAERQRNEKPADLPQSAALAELGKDSDMDAMPPIAANDMSGGLGSGRALGGSAFAAEPAALPAPAEQERRSMSSAPTLSRSESKHKELNSRSAAKPRVVPEKDHHREEVPSQVASVSQLLVPAEGELALADKYWDTSSLEDARDKNSSGNVEYEIHTGYSSEYLFRGVDLSSPDEPAPALVNLMEEIPAAENPYSTFSLNISDASFQLAKAALAKGERPDPAGIKPEQFYNAVDYGDPAPASNEPVAATIEQSAHPVIPGRNLVRVALRTGSVGRSAVQPLRLTLLVDQSGSMVREDRRASMEHALAQLGVLLTKADLVTVIGFSRTPHLLADGMTGDQAVKLSELVNQTASEGGTNLEEAMKLGGQLAERHQLAGAQNRIVLFTDGAANLGDANPARLAEQVKAFRQKGLAFDIAGIGADGLNDRLLSELARNGNGRYYVVGDEKNDSFARQLAGAFRPAAENVKVQVNFNPQRVGKYKLIGFEKDRLKTEDFRNDAVDAAELAAEEAGVAIYQVEPLADGTGEIGEVSVRFRDAASKEMVERGWTIPHESQAMAFDRATPSMQLAGLSLLAAEKLKGGPLADAIDFKQLAGPTSQVKQFYPGSPRVGDMLRVIDALK